MNPDLTFLCRLIGFGEKHQFLSWDGFHPEVEASLKRLCGSQSPQRNVYLGGNVGVGKTAFLACMVKEQFLTWSQGRTEPMGLLVQSFAMKVILVSHSEVNEILRAQFAENSDAVYSPRDLMEIPLLLIDEFAGGHETGFSVAEFERIINYRWEHQLPVWATANITAATLKKKADWKRIASRILDKALVIDIAGKDRRQ